MSRLVLALAAVAVVASGTGAWVLFAPRGGSGPAGAPGILPPEQEMAALLDGVDTLAPGESREGITVRRTGTGAAFEAGDGRRIALSPPRGASLGERFVVLSPVTLGFVLETPDDRPVYYALTDARRPLQPASEAQAAQVYDQAAERIGDAGKLPFLDGTLEVVETRPLSRAVLYCLTRADGQMFQGATRFVGTYSLTVMRVGACPRDVSALAARLDRGEATLGDPG